MIENIHFSENNFLDEHPKISTFRIINSTFDSKIDSVDGLSIKLSDIDEYDTIFIATKIVENNNILYVSGSVGYSFDPAYIKLLYDINENKIYIISDYRMMTGDYENELYPDTYQIIYDKFWDYELVNDMNTIHEKEISVKYEKISDNSVPYYRFPRSKDGISIPRVIYNIFKVFRDDSVLVKPQIIIPNAYNTYHVIIRETDKK
jgi:hypothetical protein